ncbi:hypothetical protein ASJ81_08775 [Methanosarcina spelaei]|uniref:Peptidase M12B domain-containing protein n=1 Tax=Methanosarcina spelaei TaxID=1036679 RepID=A0A2A2HRD3_9EURY|nr:hypothetical protein [Methanosarcina spelaei]PAV11888.1 hypothetical protein ASJ81_08775 [Methanosarcina spelaei]
MTAKTKFGTGILLLTMLLVNVVFVPAASGSIDKISSEASMENNISYTETELKDLYNKYNITENDLLFANNELPNYLEGTILDSKLRVIASETGKPPEGLKEGEDYDLIISHEEMFAIINGAREKYIQKYGVDPANPKTDTVNGYVLPKEEANKLVEKKTVPEVDNSIREKEFSVLSVPWNPRAVNGLITEYIFVAADSRHSPTESITQATYDALYRFENFGINVNAFWYWNYWDVSDISPANSASEALDDLEEDTNWVRDSANDMVIGWTHDMDENGIAYHSGPYAVCTDVADGFDWPHDSIVQHEVSHNFDADEGGWFKYEHPAECIMNYQWAYDGTNIWCSSCSDVVDNGIWS